MSRKKVTPRLSRAVAASTLAQVAQRCDVNPSTVSRVLNNYSTGGFSVTPVVRQKILDAVRELNYRPSMAARNLTLARTNLVAVLGVAEMRSDRVGPVEAAISALANTLDQAGFEICVQFLSQRHSAFDRPLLRVDGVIAVGPQTQDELDALDALPVPYVSLNGRVGRRGSAVNPDDPGGTRMALKHLYALGHRRIAYMDNVSTTKTDQSVLERRQAFLESKRELGFESPELNLPPLPRWTAWDSYYEPFLRAAVIAGGATAVLTYSHQGAMALNRTAYDLKLSVPRDFSIVCFNDEPALRLTVPSITAVDVPSVGMGEAAANILMENMAAQQTPVPRLVRIPESLVLRESTNSPPNLARSR